MRNALVNHPRFGSLWLENARVVEWSDGPHVVGDAWDDSEVGSPFLPEDWMGEAVPMNFPLSCVRKWEPA